jgi:hypothetical protein
MAVVRDGANGQRFLMDTFHDELTADDFLKDTFHVHV